jgi:hypothetical protein
MLHCKKPGRNGMAALMNLATNSDTLVSLTDQSVCGGVPAVKREAKEDWGR